MSLSHWLIVGVVVLLVFGPKRLSEVGTGLGEGIRNFKKGLNGGDTENKDTRADGSSNNPGTASKS